MPPAPRRHACLSLLASLAVAALVHADTLKLKDGSVLSGLKISDMPTQVVFRDELGKLHFIPKDNITGFEKTPSTEEAPARPLPTYRSADISQWSELSRITAHNVPVAAIVAVPGSRTILTCGGPAVCFWDTTTSRKTREFAASSVPLCSLAVSADGRLILAGDAKGLISLWTTDGQPAAKLIQAGQGAVNALAFTPTGRHALAGTQNAVLCIVDLQRAIVESQHDMNAEILGAAVSSDGLRAVAASPAGSVLWDVTMGRELARLAPATAAVFLPGGAEAATCGQASVHLWDASAQPKRKDRLLRTLSAPGHDLTSLAVAPSGRYLIAGAAGGAVIVWDILTTLPSEKPWLALFEGHQGVVSALAFSPDGSRFYSAGADRTLRVWGWQNKPSSPAPAPAKEAP